MGLARDIARKVDSAFFGAEAAPAPSGLGALSGIQTVVDAGAFAALDAFAEAETVGSTVTSFVTSPATALALALAKVKQATGSNAPLLWQDATSATSRQILGVPLYVSAAVAANAAWRWTGRGCG